VNPKDIEAIFEAVIEEFKQSDSTVTTLTDIARIEPKDTFDGIIDMFAVLVNPIHNHDDYLHCPPKRLMRQIHSYYEIIIKNIFLTLFPTLVFDSRQRAQARCAKIKDELLRVRNS
jgi:hypothetical protein